MSETKAITITVTVPVGATVRVNVQPPAPPVDTRPMIAIVPR